LGEEMKKDKKQKGGEKKPPLYGQRPETMRADLPIRINERASANHKKSNHKIVHF
jgi:hypothetical protein